MAKTKREKAWQQRHENIAWRHQSESSIEANGGENGIGGAPSAMQSAIMRKCHNSAAIISL